MVPPLNQAERDYLVKFANTRRMTRHSGPYTVADDGAPLPNSYSDIKGQRRTEDVIDFNAPPVGQPGLWCDWEPVDDGEAIGWNLTEKFYDADAWMVYLIEHFLKPDAVASTVDDPQFAEFTFDHVCNGEIHAQGEDPDDKWDLVVKDNVVYVVGYSFVQQDSRRISP